MTDTELQIAVAKRCGWTKIDGSWHGGLTGINETGFHAIPDYIESRDAIIEAILSRPVNEQCIIAVLVSMRVSPATPSNHGVLIAPARLIADAFCQVVPEPKQP